MDTSGADNNQNSQSSGQFSGSQSGAPMGEQGQSQPQAPIPGRAQQSVNQQGGANQQIYSQSQIVNQQTDPASRMPPPAVQDQGLGAGRPAVVVNPMVAVQDEQQPLTDQIGQSIPAPQVSDDVQPGLQQDFSGVQPPQAVPADQGSFQAGAVQQTAPQTAPVPQPEEQVQAARPMGAKEAEFMSGSGGVSESVPIIEVGERVEIPEEVKGWIERTEQDDVADFQPVVHEGQTLVAPAGSQNVSVNLPLDEEKVKKALHQKLFESVRWMAEWCVRMIKKYQVKGSKSVNKGVK